MIIPGLSVSVVIPFFNHWELTHQLLFDLYNYSRDKIYEVVVVDNGSTEVTGLDWWKDAKMLPLRVIQVKQNKGFLLAANTGMAAANGDILVLISNDVRVPSDLIGHIQEFLTPPNRHMFIMGGRKYDSDTGWNNFDGRIFHYLEGWLLACTQFAWRDIGGFDERFAPNDYEDIDFSTTALKKGYGLVPIAPFMAQHMGAQTISYGPEREALTKINREKFREKWIK